MNPTLTNIVLNPMAYKTEQPNLNVGLENMDDGGDLSETPNRKPWMKRAGGPVTKVAPEVKRRRRNYQAKKLMTPKNPLMILNELMPGLAYTFSEVNEFNQTVFVATVKVDEQKFSGKGANKKQAQQEAAEAALRGLYFDKLLEQLAKKEDGDVEMKDSDQSANNQPDVLKSHPEDETPWSGLASLAMYKLVLMWQNPGMQNAINAWSASPATPATNNTTKHEVVTTQLTPIDLAGKIPPNASEIDPVMLINQINPNTKFCEMARDVRNGATVFTLSVDFNGNTFYGSATKKKTAKKLCAKAALQSIGVIYKDEQ